MVQDRAIAEWPDRVAGWKVGFIHPSLRDRFPAERLVGPIFADDVRRAASDEVVHIAAIPGGFTAVEAETLLQLRVDIPPGGAPWGTDLARLVAAAHIGIEPAGSPLSTINDLGPPVIVSDFGNNAGLIIGPGIDDWGRRLTEPAVGLLTVRTWIDGTLVGEGTPASIPNGPFGALRFLIDHAAARGMTLTAGSWVSTGAITGVHRIEPGSEARVAAEGVGEIRARVVAALPRD